MMKLLFSTVLAGGLTATVAADESFRMFFDTSGNAGSNAAPHPGGNTLSYHNPVLPSGGGRLFIYGQFQSNGPDGDGQVILSPNYDITIVGGTITEAWNFDGPGQDAQTNDRRWDAASPNPAVNPNSESVSFTAANLTHLGLKNNDYADQFDVQHDNAFGFGDTLLGYVDVAGPGPATIWITVGEQGFAILGGGPDDLIFMGFGDDPRDPVQIPEATIVPEPATGLMLAAALLCLAPVRRRQLGTM
jgi:hypothetical protein